MTDFELQITRALGDLAEKIEGIRVVLVGLDGDNGLKSEIAEQRGRLDDYAKQRETTCYYRIDQGATARRRSGKLQPTALIISAVSALTAIVALVTHIAKLW